MLSRLHIPVPGERRKKNLLLADASRLDFNPCKIKSWSPGKFEILSSVYGDWERKAPSHYSQEMTWYPLAVSQRNWKISPRLAPKLHEQMWCKDAASFYEIFVPSPSTQKVEIRMNSKSSQKKSDHRYLASWQILQMLHWVNKPIAWQNKTVTVWAVRWQIEWGGDNVNRFSEW